MVGNLVRWTSTSVVCLLIRRTWMSIVHAAVSIPKVSCDKALELRATVECIEEAVDFVRRVVMHQADPHHSIGF